MLASLAGAGIASLGQAFSPSFSSLFLFRAFGGIWGAVMPAAKVYLADVCSPSVLPDYMAYLSSVPGAAQTFGPGLGGGLTKIGLNFPVLVDGVLSLAILVLVYFYLPESPAWLAGRKAADKEPCGDAREQRGAAASTPTPWSAHALGASSFFFSLGMYSANSMLPVVLQAKLGWDALRVGYCLTVVALFRLATSIWVAVPIQKRIGKRNACGLGSFLTGLFLVIPAFTGSTLLVVLLLSISRAASSIRNAVFGSLGAALTDKTNRGRIFSMLESYSNVGRLIGPIVAGKLAMYDAAVYPLLFSGTALALSGLVDVTAVKPPQPVQPAAADAEHGVEDLEAGTKEHIEELGEYVAGLLCKRGYRWTTRHMDEVKELLDIVLPEVSLLPAEQEQEVGILLRHARLMRDGFQRERELPSADGEALVRISSAPDIQLSLPAGLRSEEFVSEAL